MYLYCHQNVIVPLVILEAMQHRLPVITTNEGGMPDMVEDGYNGYLLQHYDDVETLSTSSNICLRPDLCIELGLNGRMKYEENFTLEIFEQRLLSILQKVIN